MSHGTMIDAIVWLAKRIDAPVPPAIKSAITKRKKKRDVQEKSNQEALEVFEKRVALKEKIEAAAMKWAEESNLDEYKAFYRIKEQKSLYGIEKNHRSKLRKKLSKLRSIIVEKYLEVHPS